MRQLLVLLTLLLCSSFASAEQALTKDLMKQYFKASNQLEVLSEQNPALIEHFENGLALDKQVMIDKLKSLSLYKSVNQIIINEGFDSFDEYYDISKRFLASMLSVQMENMPSGNTLEAMLAPMEQQITEMKKQGVPKDVLADLENNYNTQKKQLTLMKKHMANAKPQDTAFIKNNMAWLVTLME